MLVILGASSNTLYTHCVSVCNYIFRHKFCTFSTSFLLSSAVKSNKVKFVTVLCSKHSVGSSAMVGVGCWQDIVID